MNPVLAARLSRHWPLLASLAVFALFAAAHLLGFTPLAQRYGRALSQAGAMGAALDPGRGGPQIVLPPRVLSLFMSNSMPASEAEARAQAGQLGAELVQRLSSLATRNRLEVVVAEPGPTTSQTLFLEVRGHLRVRGSYASLLEFLNDLANSGGLYVVERFTITPVPGAPHEIELFVSGCVLKRAASAS